MNKSEAQYNAWDTKDLTALEQGIDDVIKGMYVISALHGQHKSDALGDTSAFMRHMAYRLTLLKETVRDVQVKRGDL